MAMPWSWGSRARAGKAWHGAEGCRGDMGDQIESKLGQNTVLNSCLCFIWFLPTRCLLKWPKEKIF